jgi:hypothetical protein
MRAISAAIVLLSGTVLGAVSLTVGASHGPEGPVTAAGIIGAVLMLLGLIAWLVAFLVDKDRA